MAAAVRDTIKANVDEKMNTGQRSPQLAVILVGDDPRSAVYVRQKEKACENCHIMCTTVFMAASADKAELLAEISRLNDDDSVDGIIVQLPLPAGLADSEEEIISTIAADKDVDGLTPASLGQLYAGQPKLIPATPRGILYMIEQTGCSVDGARTVIVGRGRLVGRPLAMLLTNHNATVTLCHSHTADLPEICRQADILVTATGQVQMFDQTYVKPGAVVIDTGIATGADGHLHGDCQFEKVREVAGWITPVPKGVGPMTVAMLMANVKDAYLEHIL